MTNNSFEEELLEQPAVDIEQSNNGEDEEQQDYESEVDSDECSEDTDIEIDYRIASNKRRGRSFNF